MHSVFPIRARFCGFHSSDSNNTMRSYCRLTSITRSTDTSLSTTCRLTPLREVNHKERHFCGAAIFHHDIDPAVVTRLGESDQIVGSVIRFQIPFWWVMAATAIVPAWWLAIAFRRRHLQPGHCPKCGYDLRATPDRCPERG